MFNLLLNILKQVFGYIPINLPFCGVTQFFKAGEKGIFVRHVSSFKLAVRFRLVLLSFISDTIDFICSAKVSYITIKKKFAL